MTTRLTSLCTKGSLNRDRPVPALNSRRSRSAAMRRSLSLAVILVCAASGTHPYPSMAQTPPDQAPAQLQAQPAQPPATQDQPQPTCRSFTAPVTVGRGKQQQAVGKTCQQPDGSLQITLEAPGLPPQVYTMQPPPQSQDSQPPPQPTQPQPSQPQPSQSQATYAYPYAYPYPYPYPHLFARPPATADEEMALPALEARLIGGNVSLSVAPGAPNSTHPLGGTPGHRKDRRALSKTLL